MRATKWSVTPVAELEPLTAYNVIDAGSVVCITLKKRLPSGEFLRMRITMSPAEARELAASIVPPEPRAIPKV